MHFTPTTDLPLVKWILTNPRCYAQMPPDQAPPVHEFDVKPMAGVRWVLAMVGVVPIAAVMLKKVARRRDRLELHFCITPRGWGVSQEIAARFLKWLWRVNSHLAKIVIKVPGYNTLALRLAINSGFAAVGRQPSPYTKHGQPFEDYWFAMSRPKEFAT